jgi:hypothetical protein
MLGRRERPDYRRELNFLSCHDYTRYRKCYSRIRVQAIVGFVTQKYDCVVASDNNSCLRREAPKS